MKKGLIILFLIFLLGVSCKEEKVEGCGCNGAPWSTIVNEEGTMVSYLGEFFIQRPDSSYLTTCTSVFADSLLTDGLELIYSGDLMGICPNSFPVARYVWFSEIKKK